MSGLKFTGVVVDRFGVDRAELGVGCHTIVSETASAGAVFVALAAGEILPERGRVLIDERPPGSQPRLRRRIGSLPLQSSLPHGTMVQDVMRAISALRHQNTDWRAEFADWGIEAWLGRRTEELADDERRAVALVAALGTGSPLAVVLVEPFSGVAALDPEQICERLGVLSASAVVAVTVTQARDAQRLPGSKWLLRPGRVEPMDPALLAPELSSGSVSMRISCRQPRELAAELALRREVLAVAFGAASGDSSILIRGSDARALSVALLQAAHDAGVSLWSWEILQSPLPVIVAAHDGSVQGAYTRAWNAAQGHPGFWRHGARLSDHVPADVARPRDPTLLFGAAGNREFVPPPAPIGVGAASSASALPAGQIWSSGAAREGSGSPATETKDTEPDQPDPGSPGDAR